MVSISSLFVYFVLLVAKLFSSRHKGAKTLRHHPREALPRRERITTDLVIKPGKIIVTP